MQQKLLLASLLGCVMVNTASAGTYEWTSDWAQGINEYLGMEMN